MFGFLQNLQDAVGVLFQCVRGSVLQLFTDPSQLSQGDFVILGAVVLGVTVLLTTRWIRSLTQLKVRADYIPGKVYYHAAPPVKAIPCLSMFGLKLETYLRMSEIPYEPSTGIYIVVGPKGQIPWIEYNGQAIGDSGLIIEFLNKEKGVNLDQSLSNVDRAVGRAFTKMLEENTHWGLRKYRFDDDQGKLCELFGVSWFPYVLYMKYHGRYIKKAMWAHGIGRHTKDELEAIIEKDLKALSDFLGTKPYLMGQDPTEVDATVFSELAQILWTTNGSYMHRIVTKDCPNLQDYCIRMRDRYWPDWDQLTGNTKKDQ